MNVRAEQLAAQLAKGLAPVYLISGDEPLQQGEACDAIRQAAREQGFSERQVMHVDAGFDWHALLAEANALSLFAEQKLIELRIPNGKPGTEGSKALLAYLERPPEDTVLLIISGKLDKSAQKVKWFKAVDKAGVNVQVWPVDAQQMPGWIEQRLRARGLRPETGAAALLECCERFAQGRPRGPKVLGQRAFIDPRARLQLKRYGHLAGFFDDPVYVRSLLHKGRAPCWDRCECKSPLTCAQG